jgi:streptogramin lyase
MGRTSVFMLVVAAAVWGCGSSSSSSSTGGTGQSSGSSGASGGSSGSTGSTGHGATFQTFTMGATPFNTLAISASGTLWAAGDHFIEPAGNLQLFSFDPVSGQGTPHEVAGTSGARIIGGGLAIDASGNVWLTTGPGSGSGTATNVSLIEVSPTGVVLQRIHDVDANPSVSCYQNPCPNYPLSLFPTPGGPTIDAAGNIWVLKGFYFAELSPAGTLLSAAAAVTDYGANVDAIAIDATGKLWTIDNGNNVLVTLVPGRTPTLIPLPASIKGASHLVFDHQGTPWLAFSGDFTHPGAVVKLTAAGAVAATYPVPDMGSADGLIADAADTLWVVDNTKGLLRAMTTAGAFTNQIVMPFGMGMGMAPPALGVDASGTIWYGGTDATHGPGTLNALKGVAAGPQFFPYAGPQYPY